jgi:hypothetical protein
VAQRCAASVVEDGGGVRRERGLVGKILGYLVGVVDLDAVGVWTGYESS